MFEKKKKGSYRSWMLILAIWSSHSGSVRRVLWTKVKTASQQPSKSQYCTKEKKPLPDSS